MNQDARYIKTTADKENTNAKKNYERFYSKK